MNALKKIPASDVGRCLRQAREKAGFTQQEAASKIGIVRTTLVAIEKGDRRVRIDELQQLAKFYKVSVNALLRQEAVHVDFVPRFRKSLNAADKVADEAVEIMSRLIKAEVELEDLLGIKRDKNFPPERPILPGDVKKQAEHDAFELRQRLGLGNAPIKDIVTLLEMELGVRVYVRRVDSSISGLFAYDEKLGPCMLLNANHPRTRRSYSAAHECGHFISTRSKLDVLYENEAINTREERYADAFGRAFLTPPRAMKQKFQEVIAGSNKLTRRHVIVLAHFFGVSREATVRRLEELRIVKKGTWDWFEDNGGITKQHVEKVLGSLTVADEWKVDADRPVTLRLSIMATEAYRQELLSEGQLSELLDLDRIELREILDDLEIEGSETYAPLIDFK